MNGPLLFAAVVGILVGWFGRGGWDWLMDWWFEASGGWLKDLFALIGIIAVVVVGWNFFT